MTLISNQKIKKRIAHGAYLKPKFKKAKKDQEPLVITQVLFGTVPCTSMEEVKQVEKKIKISFHLILKSFFGRQSNL